MIFVFKEAFLIYNNLVIQKISYFKIIYSHANDVHFFPYVGKCVLIFLNIRLIYLVQTSFSSLLVEIDRNLFAAKIFLTYIIITEKSLRRLTFQSVVLHVYIFYFIASFFFFFFENKIKYFSAVLRSKSMFCEYYFLSQVKNIGSIKRYFHTFYFQDCFVFH